MTLYWREYSSFAELWRVISPPWLARAWGQALTLRFGDRQDEHQARAKAAVLVRLPDLCSGDALPKLGADRGLPQATAMAETIEQWRARLVGAWSLWADAGADKAILRALAWAGLDDCTAFPPYDPQDSSYVFDPDQTVAIASAHDFGAGTRFDAPNTGFAVFWVLVNATAHSIAFDDHTWDDGTGWDTWGDDEPENDWSAYGTWDLDVPQATVDSWRNAIRTWKPAHAYCPHIVLSGGSGPASFWGTTGSWGDADEGDWEDSDRVFCCVRESHG